MNKFICFIAIFFAVSCYAGFGGGRSGGFSGGGRSSFSSGRSSMGSSRSSFGGSRSSGSPATISRPSYSRSTGSTSHTTIINGGGYGYGGSGGFWSGMMMGHLLSRPAVYGADGIMMQPAVYSSFGDVICWILIILIVVGIIWAAIL